MAERGGGVRDVDLALFRRAPAGGGAGCASDPVDAPPARAATPSPPRPRREHARPAVPPIPAAVGRAQVEASDFRDALVKGCADMLGKTLDELHAEFSAPGAAVGDVVPRDLADYTIMTTLRSCDAFAMENAPSWLFTMMDRTGARCVLREEFVRYTPFMSPVSDPAVAGVIFDELIRCQVAAEAERLAEEGRRGVGRPNVPRSRAERRAMLAQRAEKVAADAAGAAGRYSTSLRERRLRRRGRRADGQSEGDAVDEDEASSGDGEAASQAVLRQPKLPGEELLAPSEVYPTSVALRVDIWKQYFYAVMHKWNKKDDDWDRVKKELGLDPSERLVKAQGAVDHSDLWPTLGKLYLSQRYLVFFAAVGRNHYVARLGAVVDVGMRALPLLMRDCLTVQLESETQAAMNGVSRPVDDPTPRASSDSPTYNHNRSSPVLVDRGAARSTGDLMVALGDDALVLGEGNEREIVQGRGGSSDSGEGKSSRKDQNGWVGKELSMPENVVHVMRQFTAGGKPLVFSLIEFRDTRLRDHWIMCIKEMAAAHRLHVKLGFGSSGRAVSRDGFLESTEGVQSSLHFDGDENGDTSLLTYLKSPFRNEPPPPLLAVAAHSNVVRYRAVREVKGARIPTNLLVFSHAERCKIAVGWYVDSVRVHDNRGSRGWIERAMSAIRENMENNKRVYVARDDEPFDVARLGEGIGRLAELCTPLVRLMQFITHIIQWRNPPATILSLCMCLLFIYAGLVRFLPGAILFCVAGLIVATRIPAFGLSSWLWGGGAPEDAKERQRNVLELVTQVHNTLGAGQNVIKRINMVLGKVQTLCLWGSGEVWQSWFVVGFLCFLGILITVADSRVLFTIVTWIVFSKHFLPPRNLARRFWGGVPTRVVAPAPHLRRPRGFAFR